MKKTDNLFKSTFVKNVLIMATGTAGAQLITIAMSPIVTRLYGPEAFGIMGAFISLTGIIVPVAALTYPTAIVLPRSDKNAKRLIRLSLYIVMIMAILTGLLIFIIKDYIIDVFHIGKLEPFLYLIPFVILFAGLVQVLKQWLIRIKQFKVTAKVNLFQSIVVNFGKVGIGLVYPLAVVLILSQVAANALRVVMMLLFIKKSNYNSEYDLPESNLSIKELAKKYKDFPLYRAPEEIFSALSINTPILLLTSFFGPATAGFYSIGNMVLSLPSNLIGQSIADVFYQRITQAANNGEQISKLIKKTTLALIGIGVIPFGIVILFGPYLFELIFGDIWTVAGEYARWIALASFAIFINKPSVMAIPVLNAQRFYLVFSIIRFATRTVALAIGFFIFKDDVIAVAWFGISGLLLNIILIIITIKMSENFRSLPNHVPDK